MIGATVLDLAAWAKLTQTRVVFHPLGGVSIQTASEDAPCATTLPVLEQFIMTALHAGDAQSDKQRLPGTIRPAPRETVPTPSRLARTPADGYETLAVVLDRAWRQATTGKGAERHAQGRPFEQQPMQDLCDLYGVGFALGQAGKKAQEAQRLPRDRAVAELLGAIVYLAGAIVHLERTSPEPEAARHG